MTQADSTGRTTPDGAGPDYRFTLANERTFLAWMRTCLALLATGVAVVQFAPDLGPRPFREGCGLALSVLGAGTAIGGLLRWRGMQRAMNEGRPLSDQRLPTVLAVSLTLVGVAVLVALVYELSR